MANGLERIANAPWFQRLILGLILANAVIVGMETYPGIRARWGEVLHWADRVLLVVFTIEILIRAAATKPHRAFWTSGWNVFDVIVVGAGYLPGGQFLTVVRLFRVLRVLRAVTVLPDLRRMVAAFLRSIPALGHIVLLLGLLMYVYAVVGTFSFAESAPEHFATLHKSVLTLFGILTLEGWVDVMNEAGKTVPGAWIYFVSFILIGTFVALNFFVGVIVGNLQEESTEAKVELDDIHQAILRIEARLEGKEPPG